MGSGNHRTHTLVGSRGNTAAQAPKETYVVEDDRGNLEEFNTVLEARTHMIWLVEEACQDCTQIRLFRLIPINIHPKIC